MSFLKFALFLAEIFLAMHVAMSPDLAGVHPPLSSSGSMASKRAGSKDIDESETGAVVERVFTGLLIYEDTKLIVDKEIKMQWKEDNDAFAGTFGEDLKDRQVYVNIHKSRLYQIACRYPVLPCMDMIYWIVSHTDPKTMKLSSVDGTEIATFMA